MAEKEVHLRDYLEVIRKHDFILIISFLLIFGSALIVGLYMPRVYESSATLEVQGSSSQPALSSLVQSVVSRGADQVSMETMCRRFTSVSLLTQTVRNLKRRLPELGEKLGPPESLASRIRARIVPDTRMIEVSVRMRRDEGGSECAATIVNELISVMQAYRGAKTSSEMARRERFIDGKLEAVRNRIDASDSEIQGFLQESGDEIVWSAKANYIMTRLSNLTDLKESTETILASQKKKLEELKAKLQKEPEWEEYSRSFSRDALLDKARSDLVDLQRQLVAARSKLGKKNPNVKSLEVQIEQVEKNLRDAAEQQLMSSGKVESRNPIYQDLLSQVLQAELGVTVYATRLEETNKLLQKVEAEKELVFSQMPESQFELDRMTRKLNYSVSMYKTLLEKKLEAEMLANESEGDDAGRTRGGIEIVDAAEPGGSPVSPRMRFITVIAAIVGLSVGLAMAFLAEYFDDTYQSPEEVQDDLDISILGVLPLVKNQGTSEFPLPVVESPMSIEAESFRTLVTNIDFSSPETPHDALLVTSSGTGEGKSFTVANLAVAMSQSKGKVIVVDCDMRKGSQHLIFGVDNQVGLANLLVGNANLESVIQPTKIPDVELISCGTKPPNPVELLKSGAMTEMLEKLRDSYSLVICDSPPVLPVADALVLASRLDGVLFVADLGHVPRDAIRRASEQLAKLDVPLLGLICSKAVFSRHGSYYYGTSGRSI